MFVHGFHLIKKKPKSRKVWVSYITFDVLGHLKVDTLHSHDQVLAFN